jgi:hypothetical protein
MEKEAIKSSILKTVEAEIEAWLEAEGKIISGYDYEERVLAISRRFAQSLMQKSQGKIPKSRNLKKN